jgi:hypothetical protein
VATTTNANKARTTEELEALLKDRDADGIVQFFAGATEKERKQLAPCAREWMARVTEGLAPFPEAARVFLRSGSSLLSALAGPRAAAHLAVVRLAIFATGGLTDAKRLGLPSNDVGEQALEILIDRRPAWLDRWAANLLKSVRSSRFQLDNHFPAIRRLVKAGLIPEPEDPEYVRQMIAGMDPTELRADLTLLPTVWRIFEPNAPAHLVLARGEGIAVTEDRWDTTLVSLAAEGLLPRDRLLDATLGVLETDVSAYHARWFIGLHARLAPTPVELAPRCERYFGLLHSRVGQVVGCGLDALATLDRAEPVSVERLATGLVPAFQFKEKGKVKAALKLLAGAAAREAAGRLAAARAACVALGHDATDVQTAAWDLIQRCGDPGDAELADGVARAADLLTATLQPAVRAWLGQADCATPTDGPLNSDVTGLRKRAADLPADLRSVARIDNVLAALERGTVDLAPLTFDGTEVPRLDPDRAITPITDLDDLLDLVGRLLHRVEDADEFERALDGISRLCDQRPADFAARTAPLHRRAEQDTNTFIGAGPSGEICYLAYDWLRSAEPVCVYSSIPWLRQDRTKPLAVSAELDGAGLGGVLGFLAWRRREIAARVLAQQSAPLLAAPTHRGGWIDPRVLVARVAEYLTRGLPIGQFDAVAALLRLTPKHRAAALEQARTLPAPANPKLPFVMELPQALRYALGDDAVPIGPTASLWIAAARSRSPFADDERVEAAHPRLGPDAGRKATLLEVLERPEYGRDNPLRARVTPKVPAAVTYAHPTVLLHRVEEDLFASGAGWRADIPWLFSLWPVAPEVLFFHGARWMAAHQEGVSIDSERRRYLEPLLDPDVPLGPYATLLLAFGLTAKDGSVHGLATDALIAAVEDGRLDPERLGAAIIQIAAVGAGKYPRWSKTLTEAARVSPLHAEAVRQTAQRVLQGESPGANRLQALAGKSCQPQTVQAQVVEQRLGRVERWQRCRGA